MDRQTADLIDALKHPGAAFLLRLLDGAAIEAELVAEAEKVHPFDQSTGNRRLATLRARGLIAREAGKPRAPGRRWAATLPKETGALLESALALSSRVAENEQRARESAADSARRAATRGHLRAVDDEPP